MLYSENTLNKDPGEYLECSSMQYQPHILFVDDDPDTCELIRSVLAQAGFRVSLTNDSSKVLPLLQAIVFDAVLLDNWLPGMTGIELCRELRSFDKTIPISSVLVLLPRQTKRRR